LYPTIFLFISISI